MTWQNPINAVSLDAAQYNDVIEQLLNDLVFYHDGSTTHLLEVIIGHPLDIQVHYQESISRKMLPEEPQSYFADADFFLQRVSSLLYQNTRVSTNAVFVNSSVVPEYIQKQLYEGHVPMGRILADLVIKRKIIADDQLSTVQLEALYQPWKLESTTYPIKRYLMYNGDQCWFYLCEQFHISTIIALLLQRHELL